MSGCATMSSILWNASSAPYFPADAFAVSSCAVHTAFSWYLGSACNAGTCAFTPPAAPVKRAGGRTSKNRRATAIFQAGARAVYAMIDDLGALHTKIRAAVWRAYG